jgi:hypothetical protein
MEGQAVPLVEQRDNKIVLTDVGLSTLENIQEPLVVVAVAGLYRTGKSFLLNSIVKRKGCFNVGTTTDACTRGIWLFDTGKTVNGGRLILLDSEGLASLDQDETYDAKIFCLSLLLSSYFILNLLGVIDEGAIDRLYLVTELTKRVTVASGVAGREESALSAYFPPFLFLLRDFVLNLEHDGKKISREEYLENALRERPGNHRRSDERNNIRRAIRTLFTHRMCYTMVRPSNNEDDMRKPGGLCLEDIRPQFLAQLEEVQNLISSHAVPKQIEGCIVNGKMLASLAKSYVDSMNTGAIPEIRGVWETCLLELYHDSSENAWASYSRALKAQHDTTLTEQAFDEWVEEEEERALKEYYSNVHFGPGDQLEHFASALRTRCKSEKKTMRLDLLAKSKIYCTKILKQYSNEFFGSTFFSKAAECSCDDFLDQYQYFIVAYLADAKGMARDSVILEFLNGEMLSIFRRFFGILSMQLKAKDEESRTLHASLKSEMDKNNEALARLHAIEAQLSNANEQKEAIGAMHLSEIKKREIAESERRSISIKFSKEQERCRRAQEMVLVKIREMDDLRVATMKDEQRLEEKWEEQQHLWEVDRVMSGLLYSVEIMATKQEKDLVALELNRDLVRAAEERAEVSQKLRDFMEKVAILPEIYQRAVFCNDANQIGDFYDAVMDAEDASNSTGGISSWLGLG